MNERKRRQCNKCPWRTDVDPKQIPNSYCEEKHTDLMVTIAEPGTLTLCGPLHIMACHESPVGQEVPCVGWLANQLGIGNNILLRLAVMRGHIDASIETVGEQHPTLADTLPREPNPG